MSYWPLHPAYSRQPIYALPGEVSSQSVAFGFVFDCYQQTFLTPISWIQVSAQMLLLSDPWSSHLHFQPLDVEAFILSPSWCMALAAILFIYVLSVSPSTPWVPLKPGPYSLWHRQTSIWLTRVLSPHLLDEGMNESKSPILWPVGVPSAGDKGTESQRLDLGTLLV